MFALEENVLACRQFSLGRVDNRDVQAFQVLVEACDARGFRVTLGRDPRGRFRGGGIEWDTQSIWIIPDVDAVVRTRPEVLVTLAHEVGHLR